MFQLLDGGMGTELNILLLMTTNINSYGSCTFTK